MKTLALILCLALTACGTVKPERVTSAAASYDGNEQNSGIISANANGYVVTNHFRDRYNALVGIYGRDFTSPVKADSGLQRITDETWLIDRQHLVQFLEMQAWARAKSTPTHPPQ
jgi:hypothetical protein